MQLLSTRANVGVFTVKMACNLSTPCVGAFLLRVPNDLCGRRPNLPTANRADVLLDLRNYGDIHLPVPPARPEVKPPTYYAASFQLAP